MLRTRGIDAPVNPGVHRASEAVPLEVLPGFAKLKEGDVAMYAAGGQAVIAQIRDVQSAPVDAERASGAVELVPQVVHASLAALDGLQQCHVRSSRSVARRARLAGR